MKENEVVCLKNVLKNYNSLLEAFKVLNNAEFSCSMGILSLLVGPGGSCKTKRLTTAACINKNKTCNTYYFWGNNSGYSAKELQNVRSRPSGFIFQKFL